MRGVRARILGLNKILAHKDVGKNMQNTLEFVLTIQQPRQLLLMLMHVLEAPTRQRAPTVLILIAKVQQ